MPTSDLLFLEGEGVDVGSAGAHDFEFVEGSSILDNGLSNIAFVEGNGLGGVDWDFYFFDNGSGTTDGFDFQVGSEPLFRVDHDGRNEEPDNVFGVLRRRTALETTDQFEILFTDVDTIGSGADHNRSVGVFTGSEGTRPFDNNDTTSIYFSDQETSSGSGNRELKLATTDGSGSSKLDEATVSVPSYPTDFRIVYDGSNAEFYVGGSNVGTLNAPGPDSWYPAMSLEDDGTVQDDEFLEVWDFDEL